MTKVTTEDQAVLEKTWPVAHGMITTCIRCENSITTTTTGTGNSKTPDSAATAPHTPAAAATTTSGGGYFVVQFVLRIMPDPAAASLEADPLTVDKPYKPMCAIIPRLICDVCHKQFAQIALEQFHIKLAFQLPPLTNSSPLTGTGKPHKTDSKAAAATESTESPPPPKHSFDLLPNSQSLVSVWNTPALQSICRQYSEVLLAAAGTAGAGAGGGGGAAGSKSSAAAAVASVSDPPKKCDNCLKTAAEINTAAAVFRAASAPPPPPPATTPPPPPQPIELRVCSRCHTTRYCSVECQTAHWKAGGHKKVCKPKT